MAGSAVDWLVGNALPLPMFGNASALPMTGLGGTDQALPLGGRLGGDAGALPLGNVGRYDVGALPVPFNTVAGLKKQREEWANNAEKRATGRQAQAVGQAAGQAAQGRATGGGPGAQIVALAQQRFGPEGAKVVNALLTAEGGLGGAVGDTDISAVGSHGPFQFYGPGGQLDAYAKALGLDLAAAGAQARADPVGAASWAFDNYLGQAIASGLQQGLTGEALLQRTLAAQNPGALHSPTHYARYRDALSAPLPVAPVTPATSVVADPLHALSSPFAGAPYTIAFDVGQRYSVPLSGGTTHHRGVDLVPQQGGIGTDVTALRGGTVVAFRQGGDQGNAVVIQDADGLYNAYFHLRDPNQLPPGTLVQPGQLIGHMGQSGTEGFPHLHLEVRRNLGSGDPRGAVIDPLQYFGLR